MFRGDILKALRLDKNLSQKKLAALIGVKQPTISEHEKLTFKKEPRSSTVIKYANFFKVDPEIFYRPPNIQIPNDILDIFTNSPRYIIAIMKAKKKGISPERLEKIIEEF